MAVEVPILQFSFIAAADLSAKQYYHVKMSAAFKVDVCSAVTDKPIGVLQNKPTSGQVAEVMIVGISKINSDAALAFGDLIGTSADGQAAPYVAGTDTTKYITGQVIGDASTAAGGLATAAINCANLNRAA